MYPKIVFLDMEGTLLRKEYRLDDGVVAPSAWTLLADRLGPDCLAEEQETKKKWHAGGFKTYLEWMNDTVEIHKKHNLTETLFREVVASVEFMPGVEEVLDEFRAQSATTVLVSGGFKALADRVQRRFRIDHAYSGCEYFFDAESKLIEHVNLLPADNKGKADFVRLMCAEHAIDPKDCAFIGDGMNDVLAACEVGFSIAFNAQPQLKSVASFSIEQPSGDEDFAEVKRVIGERFPTRKGGPLAKDNGRC